MLLKAGDLAYLYFFSSIDTNLSSTMAHRTEASGSSIVKMVSKLLASFSSGGNPKSLDPLPLPESAQPLPQLG